MKSRRWVVLEPPSTNAGERSVEARFVKDAFSSLAFFLLFLWLFWHRAWLAGFAVLVVQIAFSVFGQFAGFGLASSIAQTGLAVLVGLEGRELVVSRLKRKGWRVAAVFHARSHAEAERRYYHPERAAGGIDASAPAPAPPVSAPLPWLRRPADASAI